MNILGSKSVVSGCSCNIQLRVPTTLLSIRILFSDWLTWLSPRLLRPEVARTLKKNAVQGSSSHCEHILENITLLQDQLMEEHQLEM